MKKETKLKAILGAAAVMTLGASLSSFAAVTGWVQEGASWYYYDGDTAVENEWRQGANGKWYYLGESGQMIYSQMIDETYYVDSWGERVSNQWRKLPSISASDDLSWYYFGSDGKVIKDKVATINGKIYSFIDTGEMEYDWVGDYYHSHKEDGARVNNGWAKLTDDEGETDWYYFDANGKSVKSKTKTINQKTYVFDDEGRMLYGWVDKDSYTAYEEAITLTDRTDIVFAGGKDDGAVKKSAWIKEYAPEDDSEDEKFWYYMDTKGNPYVGDGTAKNSIKGISSKQYGFNSQGQMLYGLVRLTADTATMDLFDQANPTGTARYYFGAESDGSLKTGRIAKVEAEDGETATMYFFKTGSVPKKGHGITGDADGYLYVDGVLAKVEDGGIVKFDDETFYLVSSTGKSGKLRKSTTAIIDDVKYKTDKNGQIIAAWPKNTTEPTSEDDKKDSLNTIKDFEDAKTIAELDDKTGDDVTGSASSKEEASKVLETASSALSSAEAVVSEAESALESAKAATESAASDVSSADAALESAKASASAVEASASAVEAAATEAATKVSEAESAAAAAATKVSEAEAAATEAATKVSEAESAATAAATKVADAEAAAATAATELADAEAAAATAATELADAEAAAATAATELADAEAAAATAAADLAAAEAAAATAAADLAAAEAAAAADPSDTALAAAVTAAQTAKDAADAAVTTAQTAKDAADAAVATAQTTKDTADAAVTAAQTAKDTADAAVTAAQTAKDTADQAVTDAKADQTAADQAVTDAKADQDTADQAVTDAKADQDTADQAVTDAKADQATADAAVDAAKADQTAADAAVTDAQTAKDAADAALKAVADEVTKAEEAAAAAEEKKKEVEENIKKAEDTLAQ
ncbi:hypothetical protein FACS189418_5390 [Clostridia bacterium]|nr:hypothetical protein FACS189418_5390 [Clostridia bacterium]